MAPNRIPLAMATDASTPEPDTRESSVCRKGIARSVFPALASTVGALHNNPSNPNNNNDHNAVPKGALPEGQGGKP